MTQWEIKQIIEVASKGINSVLMANPKATNSKLKNVGDFLVAFYKEKIEELQGKIEIKPVNKDKSNKDWDKKKQDLYNENSKGEDLTYEQEADKRENQQQKWGADNLPQKDE